MIAPSPVHKMCSAICPHLLHSPQIVPCMQLIITWTWIILQRSCCLTPRWCIVSRLLSGLHVPWFLFGSVCTPRSIPYHRTRGKCLERLRRSLLCRKYTGRTSNSEDTCRAGVLAQLDRLTSICRQYKVAMHERSSCRSSIEASCSGGGLSPCQRISLQIDCRRS